MNAPDNSEKRLELVYKYFSHHMRTNTAVIVAMLEAINEGLSDDSMTEMIMESGYLLDIFDRGMSVCFNHIFDKPESSNTEEVNLLTLVTLFAENGVTSEIRDNIEIDISQNILVKCEPYAFKSLVHIFLHEASLVSTDKFSAIFKENSLIISPDAGFYENPPAFAIFSEVLQKQGMTLEYNKISITLRFPDESINC
ncbi:MAG: hypothetical protein C0603_10460 [Denitrovibrio sp.]|nr:MAG: hypothetical protein C0603_10460 [Denitrovibrio sp.]